MKIEHAALQVADPVAFAKWYAENLGLTIKRAQDASPFAHFLADEGDHVMLEIYRNPACLVPDYRSMNPSQVHVAFSAEDPKAARQRLLAAGATAEDDGLVTPDGDEVHMLRDPWGMAIQLVKRREPMI